MGSNNLQQIKYIDDSIRLTGRNLRVWEGQVIEEGFLGIIWRNGIRESIPPGKNVPKGLFDAFKRQEVTLAIVDMREGQELPIISNDEYRSNDGMAFNYEVNLIFKIMDSIKFASYINPLSTIAKKARSRIQQVVNNLELNSESLLGNWITLEKNLANSRDLIGEVLQKTGVAITQFDIISFSPDPEYIKKHKEGILRDKENRDTIRYWENDNTVQILKQKTLSLLAAMQAETNANTIRVTGAAEIDVLRGRSDIETESQLKLQRAMDETRLLLADIESRTAIGVATVQGLNGLFSEVLKNSSPSNVSKLWTEIKGMVGFPAADAGSSTSQPASLNPPVATQRDTVEESLKNKLGQIPIKKDVKDGKPHYYFKLKIDNKPRDTILICKKKKGLLRVNLNGLLQREISLDNVESAIEMARKGSYWIGAEVVQAEK